MFLKVCIFLCILLLTTTANAQFFLTRLDQTHAYQEIDKANFENEVMRHVLSAWINPGNGSGAIGILVTNNPGTNLRSYLYIQIDSDGSSIYDSSAPITVVNAGYNRVVPHPGPHPELGANALWYRVFITFDYDYDDLRNNDRVYVFMHNTSANETHAVWIDGIQLERTVFADQIIPTAFSRKSKIISPNQNLDMSGQHLYFEW